MFVVSVDECCVEYDVGWCGMGVGCDSRGGRGWEICVCICDFANFPPTVFKVFSKPVTDADVLVCLLDKVPDVLVCLCCCCWFSLFVYVYLLLFPFYVFIVINVYCHFFRLFLK